MSGDPALWCHVEPCSYPNASNLNILPKNVAIAIVNSKFQILCIRWSRLQQTITERLSSAIKMQLGRMESIVDELVFILSKGQGNIGNVENYQEMK
nr:hypothetical protein CFP56_15907 [Quercus suber]